jgi:hypothetical protein
MANQGRGRIVQRPIWDEPNVQVSLVRGRAQKKKAQEGNQSDKGFGGEEGVDHAVNDVGEQFKEQRPIGAVDRKKKPPGNQNSGQKQKGQGDQKAGFRPGQGPALVADAHQIGWNGQAER